jgi:hypothetical protein
MVGEQITEKYRQPECGKKVGKLCSEVFLEKYNKEKLKELLLELHEILSAKFPKLFRAWYINKQKNQINGGFLNNYSNQLFEHIKKRILYCEQNLIDYISYNLRNTVFELTLEYLVPEDSELNKIRRYLRKEGPSKKVRCGKSEGVLCSDLFKLYCTIDRLIGIIYGFRGSSRFR